jgi:hypothetical protein
MKHGLVLKCKKALAGLFALLVSGFNNQAKTPSENLLPGVSELFV